jgi:hypothetical protein
METLSGVELAIAVAAWALVAVLAALVLLLYQQLDRAYELSARAGGARLEVGDPVPALEVLDPERGLEEVDPAALGGRSTVTFVTGSCSSCLRLLRELLGVHRDGGWPGDLTCVVAVSPGSMPRALIDGLAESPIVALALSDQQAVIRNWGVTEVPTTYAIEDGRLVASGPTRHVDEVVALTREPVAP